jgi:glutamate-ammonia-ligase adenylyltransferase
MLRLLQLPLRDRGRAEREMRDILPLLPTRVQDRLYRFISASPAPEQVLHSLTRFRERQPEYFQKLAESTDAWQGLVAVFAHSRFLTEDILDHPEWIDELGDARRLSRPATADELKNLLAAELPAGVPPPLELAKFRRRRMLRIVARDVLGMGALSEITGELSGLADAIVEVAYQRIRADLVAHYGEPLGPDGPAHFAVLALGKLGGQELNYSSDIDLMFLYSANGETSGPRSIANKEFFKRAANQLTALLSTYTGEGMCYRVDLRLRPDGSLGEVCISLDGARQYYATRARDWELQMMIKARVAAGHQPTGRALLDFVEPRTYKSTLDFSAVEELSATRERLNEKLAARYAARHAQKPAIDVKLDRGGIRDIEFLVQCFQRLHGGADSWLRHGGTLLALSRLLDKRFLSEAEYGRLASAYEFLRHLEHRLQFDEDRQTHTLPDDPAALELLARRMPGGRSAEWLQAELRDHFESVIELYQRVVHSRWSPDAPAPPPGRQAANVVLALEQRAPELARAIAQADFHRGYRSFEHFLERLSGDSARLARLNADPQVTAATLDLFEHSPYFAEELIRKPELIDDIACAELPLCQTEPAPRDASELRRWFRREMLRIQTESICGSRAIFDTLLRTSNLADAVIERAYEIAIADVRTAYPPENPDYQPSNQMWAIALGRLGMQEFDLASDADLVFVLPDADVREMAFWTAVAHRMVNLITAYTGAGVLFAVDTRLRPNGTAGPMVQTESAVKEYFEHNAEAWEGMAYMKSRAVAGDPDQAGIFLNQLQDVDWKRYGQGGRSRSDLRQMRSRLEKEQGVSHPLKAGRGGYYDIDFLLLYLRLKSAGVFFKVLNTPARIEVLEILGHLSQTQAGFLREAATFYRALDHGLRLISGHAEGRLPKAESQLELLDDVLKRWTPISLEQLPGIQSETRALFDRFFSS